MAYDEELAARVRVLLAPLTSFEERKMFGGLASMVNSPIACGIVKDELVTEFPGCRLLSTSGEDRVTPWGTTRQFTAVLLQRAT